jgi:hypothetical protein
MKPRRWYSGPEVNPSPAPRRAPLPGASYWAFTTRTRLEQGSIIKCAPADQQRDQERRAAPRGPRPLRLIDAA